MNDALYEQLVPRKQKTSGILISILIIVLAVAVAVLGMPLVGFLSFLIAQYVRAAAVPENRFLFYLSKAQCGI